MKKWQPLMISLFTMLTVPSVASAVSVAPASLELTADRGEMVSSSITVLNTQNNDQEYFIGLMGFKPKDDSGTPEFFLPEAGMDDLTSWILLGSSSYIVPALSSSQIPFRVAVPDDIPAGGYYAAITVSPAPADVVATNGAIIEAKTAVLVLLTVGGETQENLALLDFTSAQGESGLPFHSYQFRLQNQGNVHVMPVGMVRLTGLLGQTILELDANAQEGRVLPGSTRTFSVAPDTQATNWYNAAAFQLSHLVIGPVKATLDLTYGGNGIIQSSLSFWVFPWQLILTMIGLLLVLCFLYRLSRRWRVRS
ncbi:hypothetical protein HZA87_03620 [Candidatus Uhrbacteria bacterium]|nr:hypothetical protein [Candidatus Uhrbacteria bacterium]